MSRDGAKAPSSGGRYVEHRRLQQFVRCLFMGSPSPEPRAVTFNWLQGEVDGRIKNRFA
jgi:hypothetical protein